MNSKKVVAGLLAFALVCGGIGVLPTGELASVLGGISASAVTKDYEWGTNAKYTIDTSTQTVTITGEGDLDNSISPLTNNKSIKTLIIEEGITSIPGFAFSDCTALENVTLPKSLRYMGENAFIRTKAIKNNASDERLKCVDNWVVGSDTIDEREYVLPDGIEGLASNAFPKNGMKAVFLGVFKIVLPETLHAINDRAFYGMYNLDEVVFPTTNDLYIGGDSYYGLFDNRYDYYPLVIDRKDVYYKEGKINMELTIPSNAHIMAGAFYDCERITSVTIEDGVDEIGRSAFESCDRLSKVSLPDSIERIGEHAFDSTSIYSQNINEPVFYIDNWAIRGNGKADITELKEGTIGIADRANLQGEIYLPSTLKYIGSNAASSDETYDTLEIPESVIKIYDEAFERYKTKEIILHEGLEDIGSYGLGSCQNQALVIPKSVKHISERAISIGGDNSSITFLNPDCVLDDINYWGYLGFGTPKYVYGYAGSTAEELCKAYHENIKDDNHYIFVDIEKGDDESSSQPDESSSQADDSSSQADESSSQPDESSSQPDESYSPPDDSSSQPDKPEFKKGDISGDGTVNVQDISKLAAYIKGKKELTDEEMARADVNGDGEVNVKDISLIAAYVKGIREL